MALEKLRDDNGVVQDRVGSQAMISLEGHDKARQIVTGDRVDRRAVVEEIKEPFEHGLILPVSIGFFSASICSKYVLTATCNAGFLTVSPAFSNPCTPRLRPSSSWRLRRCASSAWAAVTPAPSRRRIPPTYHST